MADNSSNNRPNYFILLEIDPKAPWSKDNFEQALKKKRSKWSRGKNNPKYAREYGKYLELVSDIKAVMGDEKKRKQEAAAAMKMGDEDKKKALKKFDEDFDLIIAKGFITEQEITKLAQGKEYNKYIEPADIHAKIKKKRVEIRKVKKEKEPEDLISPNIMKRIQDNLKASGKNNLYDFLEMGKSSRRADLLQKAQDIYNQCSSAGNKTEEVTIRSQLSGEALTIFKTEDERERYDRTLKKEAAEEIYKEFENKVAKIAASPDKMIHAGQFNNLMETARARGIDVEKAAAKIREFAAKKKLAVEIPDLEVVKQKLLCTSCGTLNHNSQNFCSNCSAPVKITCPSCSHISPVENRACPQCSFPIGNAPDVREHLTEAQNLITQKSYGEAIIYLEGARWRWSTSTQSRPLNDELTREINQYLSSARKYQQQETELSNQLNRAIDDRRFYAARNIYRQLQAEFGTTLTAKLKEINRAIGKAESALAKARQVDNSGGNAIELYENILWDCKDCHLAKEALAKTPPTAPRKLAARLGDKTVSLTWEKSPDKNVAYTIVRKYRSCPISVRDGETLATVSGMNYDDTKPAIGVPIYYAVYANRSEIFSANAAGLKEPILLTRDITNVVKQVGNQQVSIRWEAPENVAEVLVFRSTNPSVNSQNGDSVEVMNQSQVVDRNLQNNRTYYYSIYSLFADIEGNLVWSKGVTLEAIPEEPPCAITNLQLEVQRTSPVYELKLSWPAPKKGEVAILLSNSAPDFKANDILSQKAVESYGKLLSSNNNQAIATLELVGIFYFTPVVLFQGMAYLGETVEYANLDDVKNLRVQKQRTELQLRWDWPKGCEKAIVVYDSYDFPNNPNPSDGSAVRAEVTKAEYQLRGYSPIRNPVQQDYYIVVYALKIQNGRGIAASGLSESARFRVSLSSSITVSYHIEREGKLFGILGKGKLTFKLKAVGMGYLPEMVLVCQPGTPPLKKNNGKVILNTPGTMLSEKETVLSYEIEEYPQNYGKLFLEDDNLYDARGGHVRINHPGFDKMKTF